MTFRRPYILPLIVCTTLLSACDNHLAVTPADDGSDAATSDSEAPAQVAQAQGAEQKPASPGVNAEQVPANQKGANNAPNTQGTKSADEDKIPEGAQPVPTPTKKVEAPLVTPKMDKVKPMMTIRELIADSDAKIAAAKAKAADTKAPKAKTPAPASEGKPNVGPFLPNAMAMWLSVKPGSAMGVLEIGVKEQDVQYLPKKDGKTMLMLDINGAGKFKELELVETSDVEPPENCVDREGTKLRFFTATIPIDVKHMFVVMVEYNNRREREVVEFKPGTPEVDRRIQAHHIDVDGFLAGKKVDISLLSKMSPLGTLGARPVRVDRDHSLMIRDLRVIEDPHRTVNPCGRAKDENMYKVWGFGHLMREMAKQSGVSTQKFVESWLATFVHTQSVYSKDGTFIDQVKGRITGLNFRRGVLADWRRRSGGRRLDLRIAPFRLLAIIYRPDLGNRSPLLSPEQNNAGELRFVFGMMRSSDLNHDGDALDLLDSCSSIEASVILEYKIPAQGCERTKAWANEMIRLSELQVGSEAYNAHLSRMSHYVTRSGAGIGRPNESALGQLRTNEIGLSTAWQMREYHIDARSGLLKQSTLEQTFRHHGRLFSQTRNTPSPASLRGSHIMFNEIQENMTLILEGRYTMPEISEHGDPLRSGAVTLLGRFGRYEDHKFRTPEQRQARFSIGVNTCDGCHTAETGTAFYHIFPNRPGRPTRFSAYLQNSPHRTKHLNHHLRVEHHEFDETKTRIQALHGMANQVCEVERGLAPVQMTEAPLKRMH